MAAVPHVVLTLLGDDGYPFSFPSKLGRIDADGTVTVPRPRGLPPSPSDLTPPRACFLCHTFDERGGSQDYVLLRGEVSSLEGRFIFKSTKPFNRPSDGREGEEFYKKRAEEYLTKIRPRLYPGEQK